MNGRHLIVVGATGMVGGIVLHEALAHPDVGMVTAVGRRSTGLQHAKLREVLHTDFTDYRDVSAALERQDAALFCLGAYTGTVPDDELRRITVDYPVAFAHALRERSPQAAFCLLSGQGADQTGRSRIPFARYKGAAERAVLTAGFPRVHLFRPGYIYPVTPRREPNLGYRVARVLYPIVRRIYPNIGIASDDLARAMVTVALNGAAPRTSGVLENRDIRLLAAASR